MLPSMLIQKEATSKTNPIISLAKILLIALVFGGASASYGQCTPVGDQTSYGAGSWIGYVYSSINTTNPPTNAFTTTYHGYLTQPEIFNQDVGGKNGRAGEEITRRGREGGSRRKKWAGGRGERVCVCVWRSGTRARTWREITAVIADPIGHPLGMGMRAHEYR